MESSHSKPSVKARPPTPLHNAAKYNSVRVAELLIAAGALLNAKECSGRTDNIECQVSCHFSLLLLIPRLAWVGSMGTLLCILLLNGTVPMLLSY